VRRLRHDRPGLLVGLDQLELLGEAEVEHFHRPVGTNLDVSRLEIAVHDAVFVSGFERIGNLPGDSDRLVKR
jgi:hypothetical protein